MENNTGKKSSLINKIIFMAVAGMSVLAFCLTLLTYVVVDFELKQYAQRQLSDAKTTFENKVKDDTALLERNLNLVVQYLFGLDDDTSTRMLKTGHISDSLDFPSLTYRTLLTGNVHGAKNIYAPEGNYDIPDWFFDKLKESDTSMYASVVKGSDGIYLLSGNIQRYNGIPVGCIFMRELITTDKFVSSMKTTTNREVTIYDRYKRSHTTFDGLKGTEDSERDYIDQVEAGETVYAISKIDGRDYTSCYFPLTDNVGDILGVMHMGESLDAIYYMRKVTMIVLIICAVLVTAVVMVAFFIILSQIMIKPLKGLLGAFENLNSGEADLTYRIPVKGHDEFTTIGVNFNNFIDKLLGVVRSIEDTQGSLKRISTELSESSITSANGTTEILANIESVRLRSKEQSDSVTKTADVLNQAQDEVKGLGSMIETQAAGITESSASIEQMMGNINSVSSSIQNMEKSFNGLTTTVHEGKDKLSDVTVKINAISSQSATLMQANTVIAKIASQTNLLAMNAAIEAAHAGDTGRGFAVVADEIRDLAENSSKQSASIKTELKEIGHSIEDVVVSSQFAEKAFGEIVEQITITSNMISEIGNAMVEQATGSQQILQALSLIKDQTVKVRNMSGTMQDSFKTIGATMSGVSQLSASILGSMDEMTEGSKMINESTQNVSCLANDTSENIDQLKDLLDKFKTE